MIWGSKKALNGKHLLLQETGKTKRHPIQSNFMQNMVNKELRVIFGQLVINSSTWFS